MGSHDSMPEAFRNLPDPRLDGAMAADEGQAPVIAHGHWHRPGTFMGETVPEEQEPILEALDGFSTVDEYREKMAALEGVQLTGDSYGYGRVPSVQDFLPGNR